MPETMRCAVFYGTRDIRMESRKIRKPFSHQVLVRIKAASVCGTDMHFFKGEERIKSPRILGHDFSGVIESTGDGISHLESGERVAIIPCGYCGVCKKCLKGQYILCDNAAWHGFEIDGGFAELCIVDEKNILPLPNEVSFQEAAVLEPVCVALRLMDFIKVKIGETMCVIGQGPIGLVQTQIAKLQGLTVIAVDIVEEKLSLARSFGADFMINSSKQDTEKEILKITGGDGVNYCVEAVGDQRTVDLAAGILGFGGTLLFVGHNKGLRGPPITLEKELTTQGVELGPQKYPIALDLLRHNVIDVKSLISHKIILEQLPSYLESMADGKISPLKLMINFE